MDLVKCRTCNTNHRLGAQYCPALKSRGGGESRPATVKKEGVSYPEAQANRLPSAKPIPVKGEEAPSGPRVGSRIETAGVASGPREFKRPLAKDAAKTISRQQPWIKEGMSRASWYRRLSEQRSKEGGK
jgi:hypothetical protein